MITRSLSRLVAAPLLLGVALPLQACGPFFPNRLLEEGDQAILLSPHASFAAEIERMKLLPTTWTPMLLPRTQTYADQAAAADLEDLRVALHQTVGNPARRDEIVQNYAEERAKLIPTPKPAFSLDDSNGGDQNLADPAPPDPASLPQMPPSLPGEFADYFEGAISWSRHEPDAAVDSWRALLRRPASERRLKSTWAAFMLGKALLTNAPDEALRQFRDVRSMARHGFSDSLGLAASSLGWEAKVHFLRGEWIDAADLYLEQAAGGDPTAVDSLRLLAACVLDLDLSRLPDLARSPRLQRVVTAYLISQIRDESFSDSPSAQRTERWLDAVEQAGVKDVTSAEQLALAAYGAGEVRLTARWLDRCQNSPVSQWLRAKLLLRDGQIDAAARLLAKVSRDFPLDPPAHGNATRTGFQFNLFVDNNVFGDRPATEQFWGEVGLLHLTRREYCESLEALLRADYWSDAAYVAERVLSIDELKQFLTSHPIVPPEDKSTNQPPPATQARRAKLAGLDRQLRDLLARRLMRANRLEEARPYFDSDTLPHFQDLMIALAAAFDESKTRLDRAAQMMTAACITRTNGLDLFGAELEPDFAIEGGRYEETPSRDFRRESVKKSVIDPDTGESEEIDTRPILAPSQDELARLAVPSSDPPLRWHYRYVAADMAWLAAQWMPNNSDAKARALCEGGSWIKYLDPQKADRFYKELVRKCRQTAIGQLADTIRWFPLLDEQGQLRPKQPAPPHMEEPAADPPSI